MNSIDRCFDRPKHYAIHESLGLNDLHFISEEKIFSKMLTFTMLMLNFYFRGFQGHVFVIWWRISL